MTTSKDHATRSYADRLILQELTELESVVKVSELADRLGDRGLGLAEVKSLLASNPDRFAYVERRWAPASRFAVAGRPFNEAVRAIVEAFGGPVALSLVCAEVARSRESHISMVEANVIRTIERDDQFVLDAFDRVSLTSWGFFAYDEPRYKAYRLNGVESTDVEHLAKKIGHFDFRNDSEIVEALKVAQPVSLRLFGAAIWSQLSPEDPRAPLLFDTRRIMRVTLSVPGYEFGPDGVLAPVAEAKKWVAAAAKLADKLVPLIEIEDAQPIEIKREDLGPIIKKIVSTDRSQTAIKLLEEFYEITPTNRTFPDDLANLLQVLKTTPEVVWVGGDRFQKPGLAPEYIEKLPEPFEFHNSGILDEEGELVDIELTDDGLSQTLRRLLSHPLALDVLDEDPPVVPKTIPETARLVLKAIHRELGTFPLCQLPAGWIHPEPKYQELIVTDQNDRTLQIWLNAKDRLSYNWIEWWLDQPIENGAVFSLTRTTKPNVFEFNWQDQPDPVVFISSQRMEELRNIGAEMEGNSTLAILIEVMKHWPKGADYLTVLAEVNVARRSSRRLVASLLSSYQCFYQRSGSPVWHFDAKKVEQGFDKTKRKFVKKA